jgi:hypothetical protein
MEYKTYLARKRLKKLVICGHVNIPYGTAVTNEGGVLMWNGKPVCATTSQDAFDFFSQNDDGRGRERGELVSAILIKLAKQDQQKERWGRVWEDPLCRKYKRPEHEDFWIWNYDFYNAPVEDLRYILKLVEGWRNDGVSVALLAWDSRPDCGGVQVPSHPDQAQCG